MELERGMLWKREGQECWHKKPMRAKERMTETEHDQKKYQGQRDEAVSVRAREQNRERQNGGGGQITQQRIGDKRGNDMEGHREKWGNAERGKIR